MFRTEKSLQSVASSQLPMSPNTKADQYQGTFNQVLASAQPLQFQEVYKITRVTTNIHVTNKVQTLHVIAKSGASPVNISSF